MKRILASSAIVLFVLACKGPQSNAGGSAASDLKAPAAAAKGGAAPAAAPAPQSGNPKVLIDTSFGDIEAELFADKAPGSVKNFLQYAEEKAYDGTIFHRTIPDFMIQGGGFEPGMNKRPTRASIKNEANNGLKNERGTLAMARTPDPHSASNQFFINVKYNEFLDHKEQSMRGWGYAVFGKVTKGMEIVDKISNAATSTQGGHANVPTDAIMIRSVKVLSK